MVYRNPIRKPRLLPYALLGLENEVDVEVGISPDPSMRSRDAEPARAEDVIDVNVHSPQFPT
jgi:hypothetical protein